MSIIISSVQNLDDTESSSVIPGASLSSGGELPPPTLVPALKYSTHLILTIVYISIYSLLFLYVYAQLWMILYYKHKRRSYQTVFLFLCLIWAALRTTLFAFYFHEHNMDAAMSLNPFWYWFFYSCPVVLQFTTLALLTSFFAQVVIKAKHPADAPKYKKLIKVVCSLSVLVFATVNLVCGIMAHQYLNNPCPTSKLLVEIRVGINDALFLAYGISLSYWILALNRIANARALLESKGTTILRSWCTCTFIVLLYASRAVYNILALVLQDSGIPSVGYGWINVTDQADFVDLYEGYNYLAYGCILFFWEILPTFIVTVFFRVQKPNQAPVSLNDVRPSAIETYRQPHHFFDNPRRYDSEDDLTQYNRVQTGTHAHLPINYQQQTQANSRNFWQKPKQPQYLGT